MEKETTSTNTDIGDEKYKGSDIYKGRNIKVVRSSWQ
jgi:hypothetical protein